MRQDGGGRDGEGVARTVSGGITFDIVADRLECSLRLGIDQRGHSHRSLSETVEEVACAGDVPERFDNTDADGREAVGKDFRFCGNGQ